MAFDRLRRISQSENIKLVVIAQRLLDEWVRRVPAGPWQERIRQAKQRVAEWEEKDGG